MSQKRNVKAILAVEFSNSGVQELTVPTKQHDEDYNIYWNINKTLERELKSRTLDQIDDPYDITYVVNQVREYVNDGNSIMTDFGEIRSLEVVDIDP